MNMVVSDIHRDAGCKGPGGRGWVGDEVKVALTNCIGRTNAMEAPTVVQSPGILHSASNITPTERPHCDVSCEICEGIHYSDSYLVTCLADVDDTTNTPGLYCHVPPMIVTVTGIVIVMVVRRTGLDF